MRTRGPFGLARMFFGGRGWGGEHGRGCRGGRWGAMTPEERENMRAQWCGRCGRHHGGKAEADDVDVDTSGEKTTIRIEL